METIHNNLYDNSNQKHNTHVRIHRAAQSDCSKLRHYGGFCDAFTVEILPHASRGPIQLSSEAFRIWILHSRRREGRNCQCNIHTSDPKPGRRRASTTVADDTEDSRYAHVGTISALQSRAASIFCRTPRKGTSWKCILCQRRCQTQSIPDGVWRSLS